jgi:hypothetical protein
MSRDPPVISRGSRHCEPQSGVRKSEALRAIQQVKPIAWIASRRSQ